MRWQLVIEGDFGRDPATGADGCAFDVIVTCAHCDEATRWPRLPSDLRAEIVSFIAEHLTCQPREAA